MTIYITSLGCDKNLVDSEKMLGLLIDRGYQLVSEPEEAEVIIVNTCCFIGDAKEESIDTIIELGKYKTEGVCKLLVACGCLAQRYHDDIRQELPEVDILIGTTACDKILEAIEKNIADNIEDINRTPKMDGRKRMVTTGGHFAYLKIAEGCNKRCTYCVIPRVRGNYRSFPIEDLVEEARTLVDRGAKELILVAQETTVYGMDLYGKKSLPKLIDSLCEIEGLEWIRIMYCYPEEITDELIETMKRQPKVCHYLDVPIQHGDDGILKAMGRAATEEKIRAMLGKLRNEIPDIAIRTTLITGFPGETQEQFENCYRFVNEMEFERLGVFTYSPEEGTVAVDMPNQVPEDVKAFRRDEIMTLQQEIAEEKNEGRIGQKYRVMIEGYMPSDHVYAGRTYMDAPEVDGMVFVEADRELMTGEFVWVEITAATEYDLIGEMCDEPAK